MESGQKQLEERILEVGNKLLNERPSSVDELLRLIDFYVVFCVHPCSGCNVYLHELDSCLTNVEQSPSMSMLAALQPSRKALVAKELLGHLNIDVKTAVASCVSEITRITAPDAPYDDDLMKEIFQMIVATFENLHDGSSCLYSKRISILETMAKVRTAVVMLDLECDALILQMFGHFLKSIRDIHPDRVFSFMETIMTMVLEESESIPLELISCLLASVKKDNQDTSPIPFKLGEKVISNCSVKLKSYLIREVESAGISLDDYSKVVTSICQEKSETLGPAKLEPEYDLAADRSPVEVTSNGMAETGKDESLESQHSVEKDSEPSHDGNQLKIIAAATEEEPGPLDSETIKQEAVQEGEPEQSIEKASDQKSVSAINSSETSGPHTDFVPKKTDNTVSESPPVKEVSDLLDDEKGTCLPSPSESQNKTVSAATQSPNQHLPGSSQRKRGRPKKGAVNAEVVLPSSQTKPKGSLSSDQIDTNAPQSTEIKSSKASERNENQDEVTLDKIERKGGWPRVKKGGTVEKEDHLGSAMEPKGTSLRNHIEGSTEIKSSKKPESKSNSEIEALGHPVKKVNGEDNSRHKMSSQGTESKQETEGSGGSEGEPLERMSIKSPPKKSITGGPSKKLKGDKKKPQTEVEGSSGSERVPLEHVGGKSSPGKAITGEPSKKHKEDKKRPQTEVESSSGSEGEPLERMLIKSPPRKSITRGPSKKFKGEKKKPQTEVEGSSGSEGGPSGRTGTKSPPRKAIIGEPSKNHKGDKKKLQTEAEVSSGSGGEPSGRTGTKSPPRKAIIGEPSKKHKGDKKKLQTEAEVSSGSEGEPLEHMGEKSSPGKAITGEPSKTRKGDRKKLQTEAVSSRDRTPRESTKKKMVSSSKSVSKRSDEGHINDAKSKRKHILASEKHPHPNDLGENLVGRQIKVMYDDGDVEVLDLKNERWELVDGSSDVEEAAELENTDVTDNMKKAVNADNYAVISQWHKTFAKYASGIRPSKKKLKTSLDPSPKHSKITPLKSLTSSLRGRESSGKSVLDPGKQSSKSLNDGTKLGSKLKTDGSSLESKSEDDTPKAANKLKDASSSNKLKDDRPKADEESEGDTPEGVKTKDDIADAGGKLKVNTTKTGLQGVKSKDEVADTGGKLKVNTPKTGGKPKGNTPKAGSKSENNTSTAGSESRDKLSKSRRKSYKEDASSSARKSQNEASLCKQGGPPTKGMSDSAKGKGGEGTGEGKSVQAKAKSTEVKSGKKQKQKLRG
ncbi:hypothetical protein ACLOJK_002619 [Asimina triloba]